MVSKILSLHPWGCVLEVESVSYEFVASATSNLYCTSTLWGRWKFIFPKPDGNHSMFLLPELPGAQSVWRLQRHSKLASLIYRERLSLEPQFITRYAKYGQVRTNLRSNFLSKHQYTRDTKLEYFGVTNYTLLLFLERECHDILYYIKNGAGIIILRFHYPYGIS